jgi:hypothetical protein
MRQGGDRPNSAENTNVLEEANTANVVTDGQISGMGRDHLIQANGKLNASLAL